jgi:predicted dienelactone hydrolase
MNKAIRAAAALLLVSAGAALADTHDAGMAASEATFVDGARAIKASNGFAGAETRRLDVKLWYPAGEGDTPHPLVIYSHGTFGFASNAMHIVRALVDAGYVVAAPNYPLTSRKAFTKVTFADISDVAEQVRDQHFLIDALITHPVYGAMIDKDRIGITGHSLGAVTNYFSVYGAKLRDPRIKAVAPIAAGDPVQTALDNEMGLAGVRHAAVPVPVLFLQGDKDVFARMTGRPYAAYARVEGPKYQLLVRNGYHIAFRDGTERHPDGKNPDCLFFEANMPGVAIPGCERPGTFIAPERQQQVTRIALVTFFDAYLKGDAVALERLRGLGDDDDDVTMVVNDAGSGAD